MSSSAVAVAYRRGRQKDPPVVHRTRTVGRGTYRTVATNRRQRNTGAGTSRGRKRMPPHYMRRQRDYFLPKSAGISPHSLVSHLTIGFFQVCVRSHFSARAIIWNSSSVSGVRYSFVLHFFFVTHRMALYESEYIVVSCLPCCCSSARACTMARNSPMLFVPCSGPK